MPTPTARPRDHGLTAALLGAVAAGALAAGAVALLAPDDLLWGHGQNGALQLFLGFFAMVPAGLLALRLAPRPQGALGLAVLAACAAWWPLAFVVEWQTYGSELGLLAFLDRGLAEATIVTTRREHGEETVLSEVPATFTWLLRGWAGGAFGAVLPLGLSLARKGCRTCDRPVRTTVLGWATLSVPEGTAPHDAVRARVEAWRRDPAPLAPAPAPPDTAWVLVKLLRCAGGHVHLWAAAFRPRSATIADQPVAALSPEEARELTARAAAGPPAERVS